MGHKQPLRLIHGGSSLGDTGLKLQGIAQALGPDLRLWMLQIEELSFFLKTKFPLKSLDCGVPVPSCCVYYSPWGLQLPLRYSLQRASGSHT